MDDKRIEKIIRNVNANLSIEGMPLTNNDKIRMRDCLTGKTTIILAFGGESEFHIIGENICLYNVEKWL